MKHVVVTWGRFNPPTIGHEKLIEKVSEIAKSKKADYFIFPTHTNDKKKNPLKSDKKVEYMKLMFPSHKDNIIYDPSLNVIEKMLIHIQDLGYEEITWVAGSDRVPEYQTRWAEQYNGKNYYFPFFEVVSAGQRDPDADGASGMSASKMREAAENLNTVAFRQGIPQTLDNNVVAKLMSDVRKGMGL